LNILIFFVTKVTMRVFQRKSKIVDDWNIDMINRLFIYYIKQMKKLKTKFNKEDITLKDKPFFENFIINSINVALDSRVESNDEEGTKTLIENVGLLEILQIFLKYSLFLDENDFKNILMIYLKISKEVELIDNVKRSDLKQLEKFKSFLLNKAKLFIAKGDDAEKREEEDDNADRQEDEDERNESIPKIEKNDEMDVVEETPIKPKNRKKNKAKNTGTSTRKRKHKVNNI
jgi:hypothetical protein